MIDVSWVGKIPSHWDVVPLKSKFSFSKGLSITKADLVDTGCPVLSYGQIHSKNNAKTGIVGGLLRFVPDSVTDGCSESLAVKNGFIFADTSEDLDGCGNCNYINQNGIYAGYHTINLKPKTEEDWKYLGYLFQTDAWRYQLRKELTEVKLYSISQKALKSTTILVPPRDEREAIVAFLDSKCASIDDAIERHKQIIENLNMFLAETIANATLHGTSSSEMKSSGVEWISQIPESWNIKRGKYLFVETNERAVDGSEELLTVSQYTGITPRSQKNVNMFEAESLVGYKICEVNDIPANTMWLWAGAIGVSSYRGLISPSYNIYRQIDNQYDNLYLDYLLRATPLVQHYKALSTGIRPSRLRLYPDQFLNIKYPIPPMEEQKAIAAFLDDRKSKVEESISRQTAAIEKLEEYRKSIIYQAVTGKIDCRKEAV